MNNSISKSKDSPYILGIKYRILENIPKMGFVDTKVVNSTENVGNKIECKNFDLETITILLIIIVIIMSVSVFLKIYILHNRCLKKRFQSRANDLDNI